MRRRLPLASILEGAAVVAFFSLVAVFATWPLAIRPLGGFYGFGNDNWGGIPYFGWLHDAYLGPGDPSFDPQFQVPFGLGIPEHAMQPMDRLFSLLFGGFDQGLGTYNFQIFSSFVLAGCTMYLTARHLTGSRLGALVAGFAFTFSPFHLSLAMQYNALASIQWVPLYLLALIVLLRQGRKRDAAFAGAGFALVALTSYYYAWFLGWFTAIVVGYFVAVAAWRRRDQFRARAWTFVRLALSRGAIAVGVAVAVALPFLIVSARGAARAGSAAIEHPITETVRYSARPWMFFIPPHDNPIVGERVRPWVMSHIFESPVYEQSIYLGYTVLLLVLIALWRLRPDALGDRARFARPLLVVGAVAGGLIMLGPYLPLDVGYGYWRNWQTPEATARLPSLGWLMYEVSPVFRFFTRAFVLVSACLALLAAIGFARLERRSWVTPAWRVALATAAIGLIALEYTNAPPHVWLSDDEPEWVTAVGKLPKGATVVEYPMAAAFSPRSLYYMFWQTKHRRATVNPPVDPEAMALGATIAAPDDPATGAALRRAGIDYVVVHTRLPPQTRPPYQPELPDDSMPANAGVLNPWFQETTRTRDALIYRVLSTPRRTSGVIVRPTTGFGGSEPEGAARARWLERPRGTLTVFVAGRPRPLQLVLTASSFVQPRLVSVRVDGKLAGAFAAQPGGYVTRLVRLGVLGAGRHTVELAARPGPQSIQEATGALDTRSVSIRLREPVVVEPVRP